MIKTVKYLTIGFFFICAGKNLMAQKDTLIMYSAKNCAERIYYYYNQCAICYEQTDKPIYWGKLVSISHDKSEWEFIFVQTKHRESTICNFHIDAFFDNENYLLLIDNCGLLSFSETVFNTSVDSSIFFIDEYASKSDTLVIDPFDPVMIWCKISYCEQEFFVDSEWRKPYFDLPNQFHVFEIKLPSYDILLNKYWFEEYYQGEFTGLMVRHYDCESIFSTRSLQSFNNCRPIPLQLFRDNGIMTISNPFSLFPKRVSFVEKYQFK